jgi:hypothetical protein
MTEHPFHLSEEQDPTPAEGTIPDEVAPVARGSGERKAPARRRASARKRETRLEGALAAQEKQERDELATLEAQGFTRDEAVRLLQVADPNQAVMRRLQFQRWLVERGLLDEFSA